MINYQRRGTDKVLEELDELIINEPDSKEKRFLTILKILTQHAESTTQAMETFNTAIRDELTVHAAKLKTHDDRVLKEDAYKRVVMYVLSALQVVAIGGATVGYQTISTMRHELTVVQTQLIMMQTKK